MKCIFADNFRKHLKNEAISYLRFVSVHRSKFQDNFHSSLYSLLKLNFTFYLHTIIYYTIHYYYFNYSHFYLCYPLQKYDYGYQLLFCLFPLSSLLFAAILFVDSL